jgi:energy-coupling factor transport system permease protein
MKNFRYKAKDTAIHHLNPLCKLAWIGSILSLALIFNDPVYLGFLFLSTFPPILTARVVREWLSLMAFTLYLAGAIIIINALIANQGDHILFEAPFSIPVFGVPTITLEAILYGIGMSLRLFAIISAFAVLTLTVHPDDLMRSMLKMRLPYKAVMVTSLATRFFPTLMDDIERITDVQKSRGLDLDAGNLVHKIRARTSIMVTLLSNSLDRTVQIAEAMESRAFGSGKFRPSFKELRISRTDGVILSLIALTASFGISVFLRGYGDYHYYPSPSGIPMDITNWLMMIGIWLLLFLIVPLAYIKKGADLD